MSASLLGLIKIWLLPPGIIILCLVVGLLAWRRGWGRLLVATATLALYLLSTPWLSALLASGLETQTAPSLEQLKNSGAQAILVLTGDYYSQAPELAGQDGIGRYTRDRLAWAALLHRQTGLPLVISGGDLGSLDQSLAEMAARDLQQRFGLQTLALERESGNTRQNAFLSAPLLQKNGISKVLLVTHAWHMPRALFSLNQAGVEAVAAPTYFISGRGDGHELSDWLPTPQALTDSYFCLHEYLGLWWYRLQAG